MSKAPFAPDAVIKIDLGGPFKFDGSIRELMRIDPSPEGINFEREHHPGTLAWLGVLQAAAKKARVRAKQVLDQVIADADCAARKKLEDANTKGTEKYIASIVDLTPKVLTARDALTAAEYDEECAIALFTAYRQRKDFIVSFAEDLRGERGGQSLSA